MPISRRRSQIAWVMVAGASMRLSTPPQALGQQEPPGELDQGFGFSSPYRLISKCNHAAGAGHLRLGQSGLGMGGQARVNHLAYGRMGFQVFGDGLSVASVRLHPHGQRLESTQGQERQSNGPGMALTAF